MESDTDLDLTLNKVERNTFTKRKHRKEIWWAIIFPVLLFTLLLFGAAYLVLSGTFDSIGHIAQIGTMLMLLPLIFISLLLIFIVIGLIYGLAILMKWIPPKAFWLQNQINRFNNLAIQISDLAAEPILRVDSWAKAAKKSFGRYL